MKSLTRFIFICLAVASTVQLTNAVTPVAPHVINYQGRLTDGSGNPISDGPHGARFIIWRDSTSTNPIDIVWDSGPLTVATDKGIFAVRLGAPPQPALDPVNLQDSLRYLGITVGADPEIAPRTRLTSVPYAYTAQQANTAVTAGTAYGLDPSVMPAARTISFYLSSTTSLSPVILGRFTVFAPGPGYLTMNFSAAIWLDADATTTNAITPYFNISLCDLPNLFCPASMVQMYVTDPDNSSSDNQTPTISMNATFPVAAAGPVTYYINGATSNPAYTLFPWYPATVSVLFTPNTLTVTSPAPPITSDDPGSHLQQQQPNQGNRQ